MRFAVDTNVLAYAEGLNDAERKLRARDTLAALIQHDLVIPVQTLAEFHRLLRRKLKLSPADARSTVEEWIARCAINPASASSTFAAALDIATDHRLQIFDSMILAACAEAGCQILLSEDMQDGFVWRGTTVVNPFLPTVHPLLRDLIGG